MKRIFLILFLLSITTSVFAEKMIINCGETTGKRIDYNIDKDKKPKWSTDKVSGAKETFSFTIGENSAKYYFSSTRSTEITEETLFVLKQTADQIAFTNIAGSSVNVYNYFPHAKIMVYQRANNWKFVGSNEISAFLMYAKCSHRIKE